MDYLLLYSNCVLVKGANRATICDLQKGDIYPVPKLLADLFQEDRALDLALLKEQVQDETASWLLQLIDTLVASQLAFYCNRQERKRFPALHTEWLFPAHVSHCILDSATGRLDYFTESFIAQLGKLCCNFLQLRFFGTPAITHLEHILRLIKDAQIKSVEILVPWNAAYENAHTYAKWINEYKKISSLICWGAPSTHVVIPGVEAMGYLLYTGEQINTATHCGIINQGLFSTNITTYTESLHFNSCLNRKISIDVQGNIKNCPSMTDSFGHITDTSLSEALNKPGFKRYWHITKDQIAVCKDCEFRHVCTDCRAYLEDPEDACSKPLKCGYDPYTGEWEEWSQHPMKQKAIAYYF
ncbi:grasp-with-spasm system SPASM domain peptide maturase [Taibaiella chishuiensis]|uniref:SPASM domain peptide maturase of grasp-with-spasm system n=1 Tax=Taibaiella chishuiensis TaxID=1434707 RepID=A0A2P8D0C7_9BACT|nr:grasp-with-spasm system SPASM domain peptide maturase [Taibaiella chishuiensis]PSK90670.1 SPASM domain peptide maturase of grasp-with-spasm system [Taibaiella chishuiensis]